MVPGKWMSLKETATAPTVKYRHDARKKYTLILFDPEAVGGTKIHWLVVNIPGDDILKGKVLLPYTGPHPPPFQIHHYILWVLEQEGKAPTRPLHDRFQQVDLGIPLKVVYKSYFLSSSSPP